MIRLTRDGRVIVLTLDSTTAGVLQSLLCVTRPVGSAEYGTLRVHVVDDAAPPAPIPPHEPIDAR